MYIKIYEDQTGQMIYPERSEKDKNIVRLFDNKIDLYIKKIENNIEISCYLLAHKGQSRGLGYYIIYSGNFGKDTFVNFKNEANNTLQKLELQPHSDDAENAIFNNLRDFDFGNYTKDIDIIKNSLNSGECLYYKAGNISEISSFCKELLRNINNIKIAISTGESNLGEVNILRNKKYEEPLTLTDKGKQVIDRQREKISQKLAEEKKKKEGEIGKNKIIEGFHFIDDGVKTLTNAGYAGYDISEILTGYMNKIFSEILTDKIKLNNQEKNKEIRGMRGRDVFLVSIAVLLIGISIGMFGIAYLSEKGLINIPNLGAGGIASTPVPPVETTTPTLTTPIETTMPTPLIATTNQTTPNQTSIFVIPNDTRVPAKNVNNTTNPTFPNVAIPTNTTTKH